MSPALELEGVSVTYEDAGRHVQAVDAVSYAFPCGVSTAIVGRSGSGKTTLLSVLALLRRPTSGAVIVGGVSTRGMKDSDVAALRRSVGVVFQGFHVDIHMTVRDNVMTPWYFSTKYSRRSALARSEELLERLGISHLAARMASQVSGGERQRVAIARALLLDPKVILADEPTGNLDEQTADAVVADLFAVARDLGRTLVIVTHDAVIAARADRSLRMRRGALVEA